MSQPLKQQHIGVYSQLERHMELIASVSRSSGLEKGGDALRDPNIQKEYRDFIQRKLVAYWTKYPLRSHHGQRRDPEAIRNKREMEENLLILFRKLREGLLSTQQRRDAFALEVYESSLHLSVLFNSSAQTASTLSHLFPDLYIQPLPFKSKNEIPTSSPPEARTPIANAIPTSALPTTLILLLHHLATAYPSQIPFHTHLRQLHPSLHHVLLAPPSRSCSQSRTEVGNSHSPAHAFISTQEASAQPPAPSPLSPRGSTSPSTAMNPNPNLNLSAAAKPHAHYPPPYTSAYDWLRDLARRLRERNYARLDALTRREAFGCFLQPSQPPRKKENSKPISVSVSVSSGSRPMSLETRSRGREQEPELKPDYCDHNLALEAVAVLVETLLEKARGKTWDVLRMAYREVSLCAPAPLSGSARASGTTGEWLARSLVLVPRCEVGSAHGNGKRKWEEVVEAWLDERRGRGEARRKEGEGMDGRWILAKA